MRRTSRRTATSSQRTGAALGARHRRGSASAVRCPDVGPDRGVVAQTGIAPCVLVFAGDGLQAADEDVVEAVAHLAVRIQPAAVAALVSVDGPERVDVAVLEQTDDDAQLGGVVALAM